MRPRNTKDDLCVSSRIPSLLTVPRPRPVPLQAGVLPVEHRDQRQRPGGERVAPRLPEQGAESPVPAARPRGHAARIRRGQVFHVRARHPGGDVRKRAGAVARPPPEGDRRQCTGERRCQEHGAHLSGLLSRF